MAGSMFFGPSALPFGDPGGSSPCWKEAGLGSSLRGIGSRTTSHSARCEVAQVAAGTVVAGRYALERCTGVGSAGSNWHAQDLESGSPCTVRLADRSTPGFWEVRGYPDDAQIKSRWILDVNSGRTRRIGDGEVIEFLDQEPPSRSVRRPADSG